ncbi:hypothetical protein X741_07700 [Mesorhizobium sp. LNHC229A00]|nr:hypothetical protein X741_07700 [Mesorhizobium sp. LNHC229A00]
MVGQLCLSRECADDLVDLLNAEDLKSRLSYGRLT